MTGREVRALLMVGVLLLLSGCANLRLYSEVRDKQGLAAKNAWAEVDLSDMVVTERDNLKKLLDAELETQDRLAAGIRDHELRFLVEADSLKQGLADPVNARLGTVAGDAASVQASRSRLSAFRTRSIRLDAIAEEFKVKGLRLPSCEAVANGQTPAQVEQWRESADEVAVAEIDRTLVEMRKVCGQPENDIVAAVYAGIGGEVGTALAQYQEEKDALNKAQARAATLRSQYQAALKAYLQAVARSEAEPDVAAKVKEAVAKLSDAVRALDAAQDAFSIQFLSRQRLDSLDRFVDAVTESKGDGTVPEGASQAAVAFILLPRLVDDARASLAAARKPLALPLLIRRNHEQLKLEAAHREIEARQARVRLSGELLDVLYDQAVQLWLASRELGDGAVAGWHGRRVLEAFGAAAPREKELLYTAAGRYLDVVNRLSAQRYRIEYMRIAASHELALAYAEVNMKQWQSLIGATVDQVAASAASGIKAEKVSALLNTIGILWIGRGVNQ